MSKSEADQNVPLLLSTIQLVGNEVPTCFVAPVTALIGRIREILFYKTSADK